MVWACITQNSKGLLIHLNMVPETTTEKGKKHGGGLNGTRYVKQVLSGPKGVAGRESRRPGRVGGGGPTPEKKKFDILDKPELVTSYCQKRQSRSLVGRENGTENRFDDSFNGFADA